MKNLLLIGALISFTFTFGQDYTKPNFKNQPMVVDEDGKNKKLEKSISENKVKVKGLGYGGAKQEISIPGGASPVRVSPNAKFIVWVDEGVDPETVIVLSRTENNKKGRHIALSKVSAFAGLGARGKSMSDKYHVDYEIERVEDGVFLIIPSSKLESGVEYAFYNPSSTQAQQVSIFSFGVK